MRRILSKRSNRLAIALVLLWLLYVYGDEPWQSRGRRSVIHDVPDFYFKVGLRAANTLVGPSWYPSVVDLPGSAGFGPGPDIPSPQTGFFNVIELLIGAGALVLTIKLPFWAFGEARDGKK